MIRLEQLAHAVRMPRCGGRSLSRSWAGFVLLLASMLLLATPTMAQTLPTSLEPEETGYVVDIVDGDTLVLADGREVRLVGIQAPKLALGRPNFEDWPLSDEAYSFLADLALDQNVFLAYGGLPEDRHGRALAHVVRDDGLWLQGAILAAGMARVYSFADNRAIIYDMLALEEAARAAGRGIWALPYYAIRFATDPLDEEIDTFQLVEGVVLDVARVRGRYFLNFGADYRDDFTITIAPADAGVFEGSNMDLFALEGRPVRVRGWLGFRNGPQIVADHPEQIEIIGP